MGYYSQINIGILPKEREVSDLEISTFESLISDLEKCSLLEDLEIYENELLCYTKWYNIEDTFFDIFSKYSNILNIYIEGRGDELDDIWKEEVINNKRFFYEGKIEYELIDKK